MARITDFDELSKMLEAMVRRVVREELQSFARENNTFFLAPDSPLYEDMENIVRRKLAEETKIYKSAEVWGDE
jgi:hypothetical protein